MERLVGGLGATKPSWFASDSYLDLWSQAGQFCLPGKKKGLGEELYYQTFVARTMTYKLNEIKINA